MPTLVAVRIQRRLWYNIYARTIYANIRENINTHYVPGIQQAQQNGRRNCRESSRRACSKALLSQFRYRLYMYMHHGCTRYMYMYTLSLYRRSGCFQVWPNRYVHWYA
jgi:hypothetical protein